MSNGQENKTTSVGDDLGSMLGTVKVEETAISSDSEEEVKTDEEAVGDGESSEGVGESDEEKEGIEGESESSEEEGEGAEGETAEGEEAEEKSEEEDPVLAAIGKLNERLDAIEMKKEDVKDEEEEISDEPPEIPALESGAFVANDDELDAAMSDSKKMNALLQKVSVHSYNKALEEVFKVLPNLITRGARNEVANQVAAMEFYRENDDLVPHKASVQKIYTKLLGDNPDKNPFDLLKTLAPEVRKQLKLPAKGQKLQKQKPAGDKKKATFAPGTQTSAARTPKAPKGIGDEIGQMINLK